MSVLLPWVLAFGGVMVAGIVALHLLARNEPPRWLLPTARFVPESRERAPARSFSLSDRRLLALRAVALIAIALAAAGPWWRGARSARAQVIVADLSRTVEGRPAVAAAVRAAWREGDRVVALDSTARDVSLAALDSMAAGPAPLRAGRLGAALLVAREAGRTLARGADSVALVLVSPLTADVTDPATSTIRATWPGGARVVRVGMTPDSARAGVVGADHARVILRASASDPVRASLLLDGRLVTAATTRADAAASAVHIVRSATLTAADSVRARGGAVVVLWPDALVARDTVGAVSTARAVFVATLSRPVALSGGTPVARWVDGTPAAIESPLGAGCVRRVAIPLTATGDAVLRASFRAVLRDLLAPCGGARDLRALDSAEVLALTGSGGAAASAALVTPAADRSLVRWLLAVAALALAAEWWLRKRQEGA